MITLIKAVEEFSQPFTSVPTTVYEFEEAGEKATLLKIPPVQL